MSEWTLAFEMAVQSSCVRFFCLSLLLHWPRVRVHLSQILSVHQNFEEEKKKKVFKFNVVKDSLIEKC